jgi:vancomycin resistance protein YoaR
MSTTTPDSIGIAVPDERRPSPSGRLRFVVAFIVGLLLATIAGAGAMYAYDQQYIDRVLPGVRIGAVDLSGLDEAAAAERLREAYGSLAEGEIVLTTPAGETTISYADIGRGPDIDAMLAEALGVGREGNAIERVIADARTAIRGVTLEPRVTYDADALAEAIVAYADSLAREPVDAFVEKVDNRFVVHAGVAGRLADPAVPVEAALADLGELDAPASLTYAVPVQSVAPEITTAEASEAKATAERIGAKITLTAATGSTEITMTRIRTWLSFGPTPDGGYAATLDTTELPAVLKKLSKKINQAAVNASFKTSGGRITGVTPSQTGYKMDIDATTKQVQALIEARTAGGTPNNIEPKVTVTQPALTTAEAKAAQPRMRKISTWTTHFPISERNGFGANIWIPARLINGYVVAPRATFDFWDAVGPVSRAKGYKSGGAIINGRTEPQGALAGGICSCSTTLFNAALRAGYQMGARRNHYYYIDRYPLGLDATVFISASGSKQTVSFTNDTDYPVLIRGYGFRDGGTGYVRFEIYSVPNGRKVSIATGRKRNLHIATDTVQYTSSLAPGVRERVEYPTNGFQVTAVRTVRDRNGNVIHRDTYNSNYATITGVTLVGR